MIKRYQHTQIGYLILIALTIGLLFIAYPMAVYGFNWIGFTVQIIFGGCLVLFATLTVVIEEDVLVVRFGPCVIRNQHRHLCFFAKASFSGFRLLSYDRHNSKFGDIS